MEKGDQLCILRAEVKTDADALNLLRLVAALAAIGLIRNSFLRTHGGRGRISIVR